MTTIGVLLSGCGFMDGSEIHEAVLTLLHLDRAGATARCFAPDRDQRRVANHRDGADASETRNTLVESARIARGKIQDLAEIKAADLDGLIMPGGFGAALNLSSFAVDGAGGTVDTGVRDLIRELHARQKPIGAICIAPAVLALVLGDEGCELTIGNDGGTAEALESLGAKHVVCPVTGFHVDEARHIVTTPAYMYDAKISDVDAGIGRLVDAVLRMAR
ncbi:MAG: isoprenoid biosynthesis glyoxalase ElbB [Planctomycetes bacterium]|nr:isoprenoid biosynthesis glyoxalase ElbB [Planctomycetota bacterium]